MKRLVLLSVIFSSVASVAADGYIYKFKVTGLQDTIAYLAHYYGPKMFYKDTTQVDEKGNFTFEGEGELPGGIYAIVMPDKKNFFEFIVTEPKFYMETDTVDLLNNMLIKGSAENELFYEYRKYVHKKNKAAAPLREQMKDSVGEATKKKLREQLIEKGLDIAQKINSDIMEEKEKNLYLKLLKKN